jgi:transposase-like protein
VQRFSPLLADAARFTRHAPGRRRVVHETYVKANGRWRYVHRAVDQDGWVIDVLVSTLRDAKAARRFFTRAAHADGDTVVTDAAPVYPGVLDELLPAAWHHVERYANTPIEADHGQLTHRLRPTRGLQADRTAQVVIARACLRAEPAPRPRRPGTRYPARHAACRRVHRTRPSHLIKAVSAITAVPR